MAGLPGRFSRLQWVQSAACILAIAAALSLTAYGIFWADEWPAASRIWFVIAGGTVLVAAVLVLTFAPLILRIESNIARQLGELHDLHQSLDRQRALLESIVENTRISDAAKSLAHREQELAALRNAIRDDLRNEKWDAALMLVGEMENRFGYKEEADRFRDEVNDARSQAIEVKLREAVQMVESHLLSCEWERAQNEIDRLMHAVPDHPKLIALQERMRTLREQHKQELLVEWDEAVRRNDTDHAIDVLKELDQYLTPAEAQSLQDSARNVFKEKLLRLGVQFRFAVTEKRWQDALSTGLDLIREFPNARMAGEVRDVLDTLRERARAAAENESAHVRGAS